MPPASRSVPLILVIEDEPLLLAAITKKLEATGFRVITCASGQTALDFLTKGSPLPDLIWLDYYLSGDLDGIDLMERIHDHSDWSKIPVVIVSNTATRKKVDRMLELGAVKYFLKAEHLLGDIVDFIVSLVPVR